MIPIIPILWLVLIIVFCAVVTPRLREMSALADHSFYPRDGVPRKFHSKKRLAKRCTVCNPKGRDGASR